MDTPSPSRILIMVHQLPPAEHSGTPLIAHQYASELLGRGFEVGVVHALDHPGQDHPGEEHDVNERFKRFGVPATPRRWTDWSTWDVADISVRDPSALRRLDDVLERFSPHLLHVLDSVHLPSEWPMLIRARGIPVIRSVWNAEDLCGQMEPLRNGPPVNLCDTPLLPSECASHYSLVQADGKALPAKELRQLLNLKRHFTMFMFQRVYDRVIFPTASFRDYFTATIPLPDGRGVVIEPGMDTTSIRAVAHCDESRSGSTNFLFLGSFVPRKGIDLVRDAFLHPALLGRDDYTLTVYGDGYRDAMAELLEGNPRVHWPGAYTPKDLPDVLAEASVGLSPSWFETYHRVTREYLAAGLPVIGTTAFGIPGAVQDGVNGLLVEPGDVEGLVAALLRVLDDTSLLQSLTEGARQSTVRSVEEEIDEIMALYSEVVLA